MKRFIAALLAVSFLFLACACGKGDNGPTADPGLNAPTAEPGADAPTAEPTSSPEPGPVDPLLGYTEETHTVYFPEGAAEADAEYVLTYTLPVFAEEEGGNGAALNDALALYADELTERVREERLPLADRAEGEPAPGTVVAAQVYRVSIGQTVYWNIRLFENVTYGEESEVIPYALVLDEGGNYQSFAAVSGQYEPEAIVAQQVFNAIDRQAGAYYGDLMPEDIRLALDLMNGFSVTEGGYEVFIRAGLLAPEEAGVLTFPIARAALYPDCVGEALSISEYERLLPVFSALAASCAPAYEGFTDGSPSAYVASAFMTYMLTTGREDMPYAQVPIAEYEAAFQGYFTGTMPTDIAEMGDGTILVDAEAAYALPVHPRPAYALRLDDAVREADSLILYGMLLYGIPGTEEAGELASVTITLAADGNGPVGFRFVSVVLN